MIFSRKPLFWAVGLGHMTVDMFNSMGPVLLAFLSAHALAITNTQIGVAVSAYQMMGALSQPLFGWLGDRSGGRLLGAGGVLWTVSLLALSLIVAQTTGSYTLMLIPYVLAALGSAAFHPIGAMHASEVEAHRAAGNTSVFFMMGQFGLALGPALAGFLLDQAATHNALFTRALGPVFADSLIERGSTHPIVVLALFALPVVVFMALNLPNARLHSAGRLAVAAKGAAEKAAATAFPAGAFLLFALVVALRSLLNPGAAAFIPRLFQLKGWDATGYGFVASAFWLGGGVAGVIMGHLADRHDKRYLIAGSLVLAAPATFLLTLVDGGAAIAMALAVGALSGGSHSLLVVLAQGLLPGRKGLASGAILGFMFATGALGSLFIGALSDRVGLPGAFQVVAAISVVTGVLSLLLPTGRRAPSARLPAEPERAPTGAD